MKALFLLSCLFLISLKSEGKTKLFHYSNIGREIFVEMNEDSTATILIHYNINSRVRFLEPDSEKKNRTVVYHIRLSDKIGEQWVSDFYATAKTESINDQSNDPVKFKVKFDHVFIENLPEWNSDEAMLKVRKRTFVQEKYSTLLSNYMSKCQIHS